MSPYKLHYYVSLWNYIYYAHPGGLAAICQEIAAHGFGIELWPYFTSLDPYRPGFSKEGDLFNSTYRELLRAAVSGVPTGWHGRGTGQVEVTTFEGHREQIDTAAYLGSQVISVHEIGEKVTASFIGADLDLAYRVLEYARRQHVDIALETVGTLAALQRATTLFDDLKVCLDPGYIHAYARPAAGESLKTYVDTLKERVCYLHLYENVGDVSHLPPGSGGVPEADWIYLVRALKKMDFQGPAVLEIRPPDWKAYPKDPLETALQAKRYLDHLMEA